MQEANIKLESTTSELEDKTKNLEAEKVSRQNFNFVCVVWYLQPIPYDSI